MCRRSGATVVDDGVTVRSYNRRCSTTVNKIKLKIFMYAGVLKGERPGGKFHAIFSLVLLSGYVGRSEIRLLDLFVHYASVSLMPSHRDWIYIYVLLTVKLRENIILLFNYRK